MSALLKQIADSKKTVIERFRKLYRTLYIQFIQQDTMHKDDLKKIIETLNLRITALEISVNSNFKLIESSRLLRTIAHTHTTTTPGNPTGPGVPVSPVPLTVPSVTAGQESQINSLSSGEPAQKAKTSSLLGEGPATAPFSEGFDPEVVLANTTGTADVLVGG